MSWLLVSDDPDSECSWDICVAIGEEDREGDEREDAVTLTTLGRGAKEAVARGDESDKSSERGSESEEGLCEELGALEHQGRVVGGDGSICLGILIINFLF